jgi:hypothetical protein
MEFVNTSANVTKNILKMCLTYHPLRYSDSGFAGSQVRSGEDEGRVVFCALAFRFGCLSKGKGGTVDVRGGGVEGGWVATRRWICRRRGKCY